MALGEPVCIPNMIVKGSSGQSSRSSSSAALGQADLILAESASGNSPTPVDPYVAHSPEPVRPCTAPPAAAGAESMGGAAAVCPRHQQLFPGPVLLTPRGCQGYK